LFFSPGNKNCVLPVGNTGKSCLVSNQSNCAIHKNKCLPYNNTIYMALVKIWVRSRKKEKHYSKS
jgi:hypothetical protein